MRILAKDNIPEGIIAELGETANFDKYGQLAPSNSTTKDLTYSHMLKEDATIFKADATSGEAVPVVHMDQLQLYQVTGVFTDTGVDVYAVMEVKIISRPTQKVQPTDETVAGPV